MSTSEAFDTTVFEAVLTAAQEGDEEALDRLMPMVYDELRSLAKHLLRRNRRVMTTTELVHEAYLKLDGRMEVDWHGRAHFFAIASRSMRQILIDEARKRKATKRGGDPVRMPLTSHHLQTEVPVNDLLSLNDALTRLANVDERLQKVVEYRFFGGMTEPEIAAVLDVSTRTVQRDWAKARAWLYRELYETEGRAKTGASDE
ncbi:ECF-type sigma factor [Longibacter salinarum]|nr:ECF-type sigma factor [Longibacter salinarum]